MPVAARKPKRKARKRASRASQPGRLGRKWTDILGSLPNYDPIKTAGNCRFDQEAAQLAIDFFPECLVHAKGSKAGQPFILELWQQGVVANLFGWKRPDGTRRYRRAWLYMAKKNGKTAMGTGILLYVLACDGELGAELYSAACTRDQASYPFEHAKGMISQCQELKDRLKVFGASGGAQRKSIVYEATDSFYRPLAADADTIDGANVHFALIDEVHRHKKRDLADILVKGTAARSQPLVIYTTTADYDRESLCNEMLDYSRSVCAGTIDAPDFLPVVYEPKRDDQGRYECLKDGSWQKPRVWREANPNLGVTVSEEFLAAQIKEAIERPTQENSVKRLHLNIVTEQVERWLPMDLWRVCAGHDADNPVAWRKRMLAALRGRSCWLGVDLGSSGDLTTAVAVFEDPADDANLIVIPWFWMPAAGLERKDPQHADLYRAWIRQGFMLTTPGNTTDYRAVRRVISGVDSQGQAHGDGIADKYGLIEVPIDRLFQGAELCNDLQDDGIEVIAFGQGFYSMAAPAKELEDRVMSARLHHGNNPVLNWMAQNVQARIDDAGNKKPVKPKKDSKLKVDGIVALCMALGRHSAGGEQKSSVYETQGLTIL